MTHYKKCGVSPDGRTEASAPTEALQEAQWAGDRKGRPYGGGTRGAVRRADVGIGPYGSVARGAMGGRPQGSPLRRGYKRYGGVYTAQKTKSPPAFAKDDALHRGTTLLRGLLTQTAL